MPPTVRGASPGGGRLANALLMVSPTFHPFFSATSLYTMISPWLSDDVLPALTPSSVTASTVAGSAAVRDASEPFTRNPPWRNSVTAPTPGTAATFVATSGLNEVSCEVVSVKSAFNVSFSAAVKEALSEADRMATIATRPSPTISADAVEAVRRGLRMAFSRPSLPWIPRPRMGQPMTPARGRAASGESIATPMNVTAAPRPTNDAAFDGLPNRP